MDRRQIATNLVMNELGGIDLSSFGKRLALQKTVYIFQIAGVNLGYRYSWYLRGPYSRELTADAFSIKDELDVGFDESDNWQLDDQSEGIVKKLKQHLIGKPDGFEGLLPNWLEVLASVLFLFETEKSMDKSPKSIRQRLDSFNKQFSEEDIQLALDTLDTMDLVV